jgi:hypothetical protein
LFLFHCYVVSHISPVPPSSDLATALAMVQPADGYIYRSTCFCTSCRDLREARQRQSKPIDATIGELLRAPSCTRCCCCKFQGTPIHSEFIIAVLCDAASPISWWSPLVKPRRSLPQR